ncbi:MAG: DNA mismatch repair protein MutS, partial [Myxococcota bacterium]
QLDEVAIRNLELVRTLGGEKKCSLLHAVDGTVTAMGARLLRRRLTQPLLDVAAIRRRHAQVEAFIQDGATREGALGALRDLPDLERLATRAAAGVASPRDLGAVRQALQTALEVQAMLQAAPSGVEAPLAALVDADFVRPILADLEATLNDEPPALVREGGVIRAGVSADLDEDRRLSEHAKDVLIEIEARERQRTGIASLKIRFNKVFGYFIEVTKSNLKSVPDEYVRKQTIANGERFITDELAELQDRIELADSRAKKLEAALFERLRERIAEALGPLRRLAGQLASVDVAAGNALVAQRHAYCRPTVDESRIIDVKAGRHAVVEQLVDAGSFVANDVFIDGEGERLLVLTGPNMAGKSTVMRQVALIVVLAQAGAYVPAEAARIGLVDRVFTRIGASDNLGGGQSTFMVEMREAAEILRAASERSLVVLDELGRGTSTYDGLAIAWSIAEHLHDVVQCRALFATHYHELCELAEVRTGVANFTVAAKEYGDDVVFLHSLVRGAVGRSYGVAVARLAGVPQVVLARAKAMLQALESGAPLPSGGHARVRPVDASGTPQLELFSTRPPPPSAVLETLAQIDVDRMAPVDALVTLARLRQLLDEERS